MDLLHIQDLKFIKNGEMLIKSKRPVEDIITVIFFLIISLVLVFSPFRNTMIEYLVAFLIVLITILVYYIDITYSSILITKEDIHIRGYFKITGKVIQRSKFEGYGFEEKSIPGYGFYEQLYLKTNSGEKFSIVKKAYVNYPEIQLYLENHFQYLGKEELKGGKRMAFIFNILWYLVGIFALIVAILKFL